MVRGQLRQQTAWTGDRGLSDGAVLGYNRHPPDGADALMEVEHGGAESPSVEGAVWDTIWLVAQLPGMAESYERLLQYGRMVSHGVPTRAAAALLLEIVEL